MQTMSIEDLAVLCLKILLALGAAYLAFASVAVETRSPDATRPWFKRLNRYGLAALTVAGLILISAIGVEILNARSEAAKADQMAALRTSNERLVSDLATSKAMTETALEHLRAAKRESELFTMLTEKSTVEIARGRYEFDNTVPAAVVGPGRVKIANEDREGGFLTVQGGDMVAWQMECPHGESWRDGQAAECTGGVLGHFEGRGRHGFQIRTSNGRMTIPGEEAPGPLIYDVPGGHCAGVLKVLQEQRCALNVQHVVTGATLARRKIEQRNFGIAKGAADMSDFCRHYRLLHGRPCETGQ